MYKLIALPSTPVETLEQARAIASEEGIRYAYMGNIPDHPSDHTYCHHYGEIIIRHLGFTIVEFHMTDGRCGFCRRPISGVWRKRESS